MKGQARELNMILNTRTTFLCLALSVVLVVNAGCGGGQDQGTPPQSQIAQLRVTPINATVPPNSTQKFVAWATYSDGSQRDISASIQWSSSDTTVAAFAGLGVAQTGVPGTAHIKAEYEGIKNTTDMNVTMGAPLLQRVQIDWGLPVINNGVLTGQYFTATGYFEDGSTQDFTQRGQWASSDTKLFTIDDDGRDCARYAAASGATVAPGRRGRADQRRTSARLVEIAGAEHGRQGCSGKAAALISFVSARRRKG